jgi:hypothetical protein
MSILGVSFIEHISQLHGFQHRYLAKDIVRKFLSPTLQGENLFTGSGDDDSLVSSLSLLFLQANPHHGIDFHYFSITEIQPVS